MSQPLRLALLLALLAFPLLEIGIMIRAGQEIGFWRLALIVVLTAFLGTAVIRRTGLRVLTRARAQMDAGRGHFEPLFDGLLQLTAGTLLIFPGLISDCLGLILLIPLVRETLVSRVLPRLFTPSPFGSDASGAQYKRKPAAHPASGPEDEFDPAQSKGVTIEGEFERIKEETVRPERALKTRPGSK